MPVDDGQADDDLDPEGPGPEDLADLGDDGEADLEPCPECGAEIYHDADRCPRCGHSVVRGAGADAGKKLPLLWYLVLALAAGLLAAGMMRILT